MITKYIEKNYINNYSDIKSFSNDKEFNKIINKLDVNKKIKIKKSLIHKESEINQIEQFIFNLDNYISYIKDNIHINSQEIKYIINLTLYNKYNKILYSDMYYYTNEELYIKEFNKLFMNNYNKNKKLLNLKNLSFKELITIINIHKKRTYCLFEKINNNNMNFYKSLIDSIEQIHQE